MTNGSKIKSLDKLDQRSWAPLSFGLVLLANSSSSGPLPFTLTGGDALRLSTRQADL